MIAYSVSKYVVIAANDGRKIDMLNADMPVIRTRVRRCGGVVRSKNRTVGSVVMEVM
jgi:hypothetical protein